MSTASRAARYRSTELLEGAKLELINATKMQAGYTLGMEPSGRERVVVVVKGTFAIPEDHSEAVLADEQAPLVMADEFTGEPGFSATLYESEFAPYKPRCDVLLNGSAYAPGGKPAERVAVRMRLGSLDKSFEVVGERIWDKVLLGVAASYPVPFARMPISYDRAYGGSDAAPNKPEKSKCFTENPVGIGFYPMTPRRKLVGKPLPNTCETGRIVDTVSGKYRPMAFGPIGRNFAARLPLAGTYDQEWQDNVFPFLPADFDPLYHQSAPRDQQVEYPSGGEDIELENLTPEGTTRFRLPAVEVPVEFTTADYERTTSNAVLDTIIIEPDLARMMLLWRASLPLQKNIFEVIQSVVGRMPKGWYRARDLGKTYYPSIRDLVAAKKRGE